MPDRGYSSSRAGSAEQISSQQQAAANSQAAAEAYRLSLQRQESLQQAHDNAIEADINLRYTGNVHRTAWRLTTTRRQLMNIEPLVFNVNPASYQFDNPFRQTVVQAKGGPVVHTFRDPHNNQTNLGYPTINIEMSSGSLMPRPSSYQEIKEGEVKHWTPSPNVSNFYKWLEIVQEDYVYQDEQGNIQPNYQIIEMSTLLFPRIILEGYFVTNANWSEQAENPAEVQNWQTQFLIYNTTPTLKNQDLSGLFNHYEEEFNKQQL